MKKKTLPIAWHQELFSGVDSISGKVDIFAIVARQRVRTPRGYKIARIEELPDGRWVHMFYKDPVVPTFWQRFTYAFFGKNISLFYKSPVVSLGESSSFQINDKK